MSANKPANEKEQQRTLPLAVETKLALNACTLSLVTDNNHVMLPAKIMESLVKSTKPLASYKLCALLNIFMYCRY